MIENNPYFFGRPIPGFPAYCVTPDGFVWTKRTPRTKVISHHWTKMKPSVSKKNGYFKLKLFEKGVKKYCTVHHLVLLVFVGPKPNGMFGCHNDGNPQNNHVDNLRWDTPRSNSEDVIKHKSRAGTKNPRAKITEDDVREIKRMRKEGMTYVEIAKSFPVKPYMVWAICNGKNWWHVQ